MFKLGYLESLQCATFTFIQDLKNLKSAKKSQQRKTYLLHPASQLQLCKIYHNIDYLKEGLLN